MNAPFSHHMTSPVIALAQCDFTVGDICGNAKKIIALTQQAQQAGAQLVVFPELALCGYPPEDLLFRQDFHKAMTVAMAEILPHSQHIDILLGYADKIENNLFNKAAYLRKGCIIGSYAKQILPNYGVFDEKRYFTAGNQPLIVNLQTVKIAIAICEDLWVDTVAEQAKIAGAQLIISLNASPYDQYKIAVRQATIKQRVLQNNLPIIYVGTVGAQDDLVFDGGSFAMNHNSDIVVQAPSFKEDLMLVTINEKGEPLPGKCAPALSQSAAIYQALVVATRVYADKNGFKQAILGLSGGIDSALVTCIAVDALGKENVHVYMLPSRYSAQMSYDDSVLLCKNLGINFSLISIEPLFEACINSLADTFKGLPNDVTEENLQARCRGILLMAVSNKKGALLLATSNKSETAVGYATLYGDMAGGFSVIKDVYKTQVYELAIYRNSISQVIPNRIIQRAPSAELAPDQKDQDTLPPYPVLDPILQAYLEKDASLEDLVSQGFDETIVSKVLRMVARNEYKRRQAAPGPKISPRAFYKERRYPITSQFKDGNS